MIIKQACQIIRIVGLIHGDIIIFLMLLDKYSMIYIIINMDLGINLQIIGKS